MIVNFPSNDPAAAILTQLRNRMEELDSIYEKLEVSHGLLNTLEQFASTAERDYDTCLTQYANLVGAENLEAQMLHYSQNTKAVHDGDLTWHLEWENNDED